MFQSLPLTIREVKATEAVLNRVYEAARKGHKGDTLALVAGLRPEEYRRLCELDPLTLMAEQKGRADGENALSEVLHAAALAGDTKAAETILKHKHDWVAKQQVQVDVTQQISIHAALEKAQTRLLEMVEEVPSAAAPLLSGTRDRTDGEALESRDQGRPRKVRPVGVPLG
jgi:hypothetical protein